MICGLVYGTGVAGCAPADGGAFGIAVVEECGRPSGVACRRFVGIVGTVCEWRGGRFELGVVITFARERGAGGRHVGGVVYGFE